MSAWIDHLERLSALRRDGVISDAEFESAKQRVMDEAASLPPLETTQLNVEAETYEQAPTKRASRIVIVALVVALILGVVGAKTWLGAGASPQDRLAVVGSQDANCRVTAETSGAVKEIIPRGTQVRLAHADGGWSHINGRDCWVKDSLLTAQNVPEEKEGLTSFANGESLESRLTPALYQLDTNPNTDPLQLAKQLLTKSKQCIGTRGYGAGKTRV